MQSSASSFSFVKIQNAYPGLTMSKPKTQVWEKMSRFGIPCFASNFNLFFHSTAADGSYLFVWQIIYQVLLNFALRIGLDFVITAFCA